MQIAVGEGHHPVGHPLHRAGDGACKPQDHQHRDQKPRQGSQDRDQHGTVNKLAIIRLRNLDNQRPLGSPNGRKGHQHLFSIDGILGRSRLAGGDPFRRVPAAAEPRQRALVQDERLVGVAGNHTLPVDHIGHAASAQIDAADYIVEQVIFVHPHHIEGGLAVLLHRHSHGNAQLALKDGGGVGR